MAMNKTEIETIRNIIERLKRPNCGCAHGPGSEALVAACNGKGIEAPSRLYLDTWVIGALENLLPESRNIDLAARLSR